MREWGFLTNHGRALLCIAQDPDARLRDLAAALDITERTAYGIVVRPHRQPATWSRKRPVVATATTSRNTCLCASRSAGNGPSARCSTCSSTPNLAERSEVALGLPALGSSTPQAVPDTQAKGCEVARVYGAGDTTEALRVGPASAGSGARLRTLVAHLLEAPDARRTPWLERGPRQCPFPLVARGRRDVDLCVVWLRGEHDIVTVSKLARTLARASRSTTADVVVDLSGVRFMGAETVGAIVRCPRAQLRRGRGR